MPSLGSLEKKIDELMKQMREMRDLVKPQEKERDPSIAGFCERHGISRSQYLNLRRAGKGPRETVIGKGRVRITEDAEAQWIKAQEAEAVVIEQRRAAIREERRAGRTN
jgi:hypothetical protein